MALGPRVLVGFAESLAAIESAWSLREAGFEVVAFTRAGRRPPLAAVKGIRLVELPAPEIDAAASIAALRVTVSTERPAAVLPLDDASLWLIAAIADSVPEVAIAGPVGANAQLALDKAEQLKLAESAGFAVPGEGQGPWMVKSALAVAERDGKLARPAGAVARDHAEIARLRAQIGEPVLVQPLIDGVGEGVFGFADGKEVFGLSAHRRVRMMNPRGSGSSACESIPVDPALAEAVRRFVAEAGWRGIFMIELLRDPAGRPWFMELNGRAWGSMALALRRGLPYPQWAVRFALDPSWRPTAVPEAPHIVCRHLGREAVHLLAVLRGARGADVGRWPSRGATLRAVLRPGRRNRWYNWRRGEASVFLRDAWATVAEQLGRRR